MTSRKKILTLLGLWVAIGALVAIGGRSIDRLMIAIWLAVLSVGSGVALFWRRPKDVPGDTPAPTTYLVSLLPRRWQFWVMGEEPPKDPSRRQRED